MLRAVCGLALSCALAVGCATKPENEAAGTPVPYQLIAHDVDRSTLSTVERRGFDLYVRDIAASRATNAALATLAGRGRARNDVAGWIVVPYEQGFLVRFITQGEQSVIDVSVDPFSALAPYVVENEPGKSLSARETAMWRARQLAIQEPIARCSDHYNTVVLPESDRDDADWLVYLIAVAMDSTHFAVGGHHRIRVDSEGRRILERFALSKSCISPEYDPGSAGFVMTHLVSSEPVETQVYVSLLHGITLYVGVVEPRRSWKVEEGRVQPLD
ncbi:MAG: hypothetical protein IPK00_11430 [Deltaproteobacteria bacterium]|nr:hypothetical protein [Deltaproteobacteria bacterium]